MKGYKLCIKCEEYKKSKDFDAHIAKHKGYYDRQCKRCGKDLIIKKLGRRPLFCSTSCRVYWNYFMK